MSCLFSFVVKLLPFDKTSSFFSQDSCSSSSKILSFLKLNRKDCAYDEENVNSDSLVDCFKDTSSHSPKIIYFDSPQNSNADVIKDIKGISRVDSYNNKTMKRDSNRPQTEERIKKEQEMRSRGDDEFQEDNTKTILNQGEKSTETIKIQGDKSTETAFIRGEKITETTLNVAVKSTETPLDLSEKSTETITSKKDVKSTETMASDQNEKRMEDSVSNQDIVSLGKVSFDQAVGKGEEPYKVKKSTKSPLSNQVKRSSETQASIFNRLSQMEENNVKEIAKILSCEIEQSTLCNEFLNQIMSDIEVDYCSVSLVNEDCACRCLNTRATKKCFYGETVNVFNDAFVDWGEGLTGHVAQTGEVLNILDITDDSRFAKALDLVDPNAKSILCMPIFNTSGNILGVLQVGRENNIGFTEEEMQNLSYYISVFSVGLQNRRTVEVINKQLNENDIIIKLSSTIFDERKELPEIMNIILRLATSSVNAERAQILLFSDSKKDVTHVYNMSLNERDEDMALLEKRRSQALSANAVSKKSIVKALAINKAIVAYVGRTGETLNIPDAHNDSRVDSFFEEFDQKSLLVLPVKNPAGAIIGVIQFFNKDGGEAFSKNDELFLDVFALFCGMGIHNTKVHEATKSAMAKMAITLDMLSCQVTATPEESSSLKIQPIPFASTINLYSFTFDDEHLKEDETPTVVVRMMLELDFLNKFHIDYFVLCRWILTVKKNYRNILYHNWRHALNVCQMMFAILMATKWYGEVFDDIDTLALLIACICHDVDHKGTNNEFQVEMETPLSQLYTSSSLEKHNFSICLMILNSKDTEILASFSSEDYKKIVGLIERLISSTNLQRFTRQRQKFFVILHEKKWDWNDPENLELLMSMLMMACDLCAIAKPWAISIKAVAKVIGEYFGQDNTEKKLSHMEPTNMIDPNLRKDIPELELNFIDYLCISLFKALSELSGAIDPLYKQVLTNRDLWVKEQYIIDKNKSDFYKLFKEYDIHFPEEGKKIMSDKNSRLLMT